MRGINFDKGPFMGRKAVSQLCIKTGKYPAQPASVRFNLCIFMMVIALLLPACEPLQIPPVWQTKTPIPTQSSTLLIPTPVFTTLIETPTALATTPATNQPTCEETSGVLLERQLDSQILGTELPYLVYLPPCYGKEPGRSYPVLYLLHGLLANETLFEDLDLAIAADRLYLGEDGAAFLVVMPRVPEMNKYPDDTNSSVFTQELLPSIDSTYQTIPERSGRVIGGISRGATWALRIGLENWQYFGKIGLHSLAMEYPEVNVWVDVLKGVDPEDRPALFMDAGSEDDDQASVQSLSFELNKASIAHTYHLLNGSHDEDYWHYYLPDYLAWYARGW